MFTNLENTFRKFFKCLTKITIFINIYSKTNSYEIQRNEKTPPRYPIYYLFIFKIQNQQFQALRSIKFNNKFSVFRENFINITLKKM